MNSVALTRVRIKFGRPKFPSIHEVFDYLQGIAIAAVPPDILLRVYHNDELAIFPDWFNITLAGFWILMGWMRYATNERPIVSGKLPPLEGRKERFVSGVLAGIILSIALYRFDIWWAWIVILLSILEKRLPPPKQSA